MPMAHLTGGVFTKQLPPKKKQTSIMSVFPPLSIVGGARGREKTAAGGEGRTSNLSPSNPNHRAMTRGTPTRKIKTRRVSEKLIGESSVIQRNGIHL